MNRLRRLLGLALPLSAAGVCAALAVAEVGAQPAPDPIATGADAGPDGTSAPVADAGAERDGTSDAGAADGSGANAGDAAAPVAEAVVEQCLGGFAAAQSRRRESQLLAARAALVRCGQADCPPVVRAQCVAWLGELDAALPTIVVVAEDGAGNDAVEVRLGVDGVTVRERLDGTPVPLDPGVHRLRFELDGHVPIERRIVVAQGEKDRKVRAAFVRVGADAGASSTGALAPSDELEPGPTDLELVAWTGFGVAAAGAALGTATGIAALVGGAALRGRCADDLCAPDEQAALDRGTALAHVSTVSVALAGAGLVVGIVSLALPGGAGDAGAPVALTVGGGTLGLRARF
ncbi:MAG: hypothetical protein HY908_36365 [Myxococcales bacterium]|nr:hypothetical protein [Myxococcales bacterium]